MPRRILLLTFACFFLGSSLACQGGGSNSNAPREPATTIASASPTKTVSREEAMATAQKLHSELDRLETAGDVDGQGKYFADNVTRMDSFRPMLRGKAEWLALQKNLRASQVGFKVESISTKVVEAWQEGDRLYEYGTAEMIIRLPGGGGPDPVNYFATWRVLPASQPQIEFIIWNSTQPVEQLKGLATASAK